MSRLLLRLSGHVMLAGTVLGVIATIRRSDAAPGFGVGSEAFNHGLAYTMLMAAAWLLCHGAVAGIDLLNLRTRRPADPYEAHPKMSPSVQPRDYDRRR